MLEIKRRPQQIAQKHLLAIYKLELKVCEKITKSAKKKVIETDAWNDMSSEVFKNYLCQRAIVKELNACIRAITVPKKKVKYYGVKQTHPGQDNIEAKILFMTSDEKLANKIVEYKNIASEEMFYMIDYEVENLELIDDEQTIFEKFFNYGELKSIEYYNAM